MLKKHVEQYINEKINEAAANKTIELYREEKSYADKNNLFDENKQEITLAEPEKRFEGAYIERGDKETEEFLGEESAEFLKEAISYFKNHKNEFMYLESKWWEYVNVDAVSFEADDVFGTYDVMLGLKLQKKYGEAIKTYLSENLQGAEFDLMFDGNEGIWSLNFALNNLDGYQENMTIGGAYSQVYSLLFGLSEQIEKR